MNYSLAVSALQQRLRRNRKTGPCFDSAGAELLSQRLQQVRLDPEYVKLCHSSIYEELERVCESCRFQRICAQDLAGGDVESGMRIYCLNAPAIDAMTVNWAV